jgi:hypothetical protein
MSDLPATAFSRPAEEAAYGRPSMTRGLFWGGALSLPLWALIGVAVARLL